MSRQWVKLHVCILNDPKIIRLAPAMRWHFVALMAAAGEVDKDGLLGEPEDVAVRLRVSDEELAHIVAALGKKIKTDKKGLLWVADWKDWQSPRDRTNAERQARHRNTRRNAVTNGHVTPLELELESEVEQETERKQETTEGTASAVAAPATAPEPVETAPPKREPLGPGAKLFKRLTNANPNIEQRMLLDAAHERHGPEKFESVVREWLRLGYRKQNADGMVNVMERGWTKRPPLNGRGVLANGHSASTEEAAAIDQVIAEGMADVTARLEAPAPSTTPAAGDADRLWRNVHAGLALRMPAATLKAWVDPVKVVGFDGETLTLLAPNAAAYSWLTQRLARELDEVLAYVAPEARVVVLAPEAAVGSVAA